jgi:FdrA protein
MCLLDASGVGVRHCLGVGGRDLSADVGGRATLQALRMLDEDAQTELIVLVSKPPAKEVAEVVSEAARSLSPPSSWRCWVATHPTSPRRRDRCANGWGRRGSCPSR